MPNITWERSRESDREREREKDLIRIEVYSTYKRFSIKMSIFEPYSSVVGQSVWQMNMTDDLGCSTGTRNYYLM